MKQAKTKTRTKTTTKPSAKATTKTRAKARAKPGAKDIGFECYYAAKSDDVAALEALGAQVGDLRKVVWQGRSLLIHAALNGGKRVVGLLIKKKCDVNEADDAGYTALHASAEYGFFDIGKMLLEAKAAVEVSDKKGNTPLSLAVFYFKDDLRMIELLTEHGADPFQKDQYGESPYDFAGRSDKEDVVKYFDERRAT